VCGVALCAALACSTGMPYAEAVGEMGALAPGQGRIVLYMPADTEVVGLFPNLLIDGAVVGRIKAGTFFFVDRDAGPHVVGVRADERLAAFGNQGATEPVSLDLEPGQTAYVRVDVVATVGMVKPVLTPEDAADAQRDLEHLDEVPPVPEKP
jgi:hypothetical protein